VTDLEPVAFAASALVAPNRVNAYHFAHRPGCRPLLDGQGRGLHHGSVELDLQRQAISPPDTQSRSDSPGLLVQSLRRALRAIPATGVALAALSAHASSWATYQPPASSTYSKRVQQVRGVTPLPGPGAITAQPIGSASAVALVLAVAVAAPVVTLLTCPHALDRDLALLLPTVLLWLSDRQDDATRSALLASAACLFRSRSTRATSPIGAQP
jgi:hypothetical protein